MMNKINVQHSHAYCKKCKKGSDFLELAYWADSSYKCPFCFNSVEIIQYPPELIIKGEISNINKPIIVIVIDGLYIAGAQKHCLFLLDAFRDLGFETIVISIEGGGLWTDLFIEKSSCVIISNSNLKTTWHSITELLPEKSIENICLFSTHLVAPTLWAVNNLPQEMKIYANLHSEPSEHEIFTKEMLQQIINRCNSVIFPSKSTLETFMNYSVDFSLNKDKLLVLDNLLYDVNLKVETKKPLSTTNIAVVSRIDEDKFSIPLFIDTIKILTKEINNLQVKVAGSGELYDKLDSVIREEQLGAIISLEGFVLDTSTIYNWATVVFLPSKRESMPYVMVESLAYNIPVVLPKCGYTVYAENNKFIYPFEIGVADNAADKIIQAVEEHKENYTDSQQLETNGDLDWKEQVRQCYFYG